MSQQDWKVWLATNLVLLTHSFFLYRRTLRTWLWLVHNHHWMSLLESWNWCFLLSPWILKIFEEGIWFHLPNWDIVSSVPVYLEPAVVRNSWSQTVYIWKNRPLPKEIRSRQLLISEESRQTGLKPSYVPPLGFQYSLGSEFDVQYSISSKSVYIDSLLALLNKERSPLLKRTTVYPRKLEKKS
jgi:hypothetical protein